ncbi:sigma-70 family RNA polymerase sigma factor [Mucilaginibacter jinjuensis]|uniref:Sigma-70 family RNA polymerase sigma factor n=1 Tax=Mucilaginibacter jinjuensis TaxID=1176721 RepID=A0ABY7TBR2_9SPHI|nr:sigma-70 family RNA polymerase sigma factor [Mucilaginibacter jinjuensis]WCT13401.1 sigma-70 family RNA polymerase sigma factor [Mucilaginibacter jinjuensis]
MQEQKRQLIENIYGKFWKELYIVAFRRLRSEEDVEDILQDLFLSLLTGNVNLDNDDSIRAFLHQRLKSRIINFYRKQLIQRAYEEKESVKSEIADTHSDTQLLSRELEAIVQQEINRMPEKMKEIFLLSRNDLKTTEEIANQLQLSNQTVRNQISSAIKRIRTAVNDYKQADVSPTSLHIAITIGALLLINH